MSNRQVRLRILPGLTPYTEAHALQLERVEQRKKGAAGDTLILLEHPPVITLGRRADPAGVKVPASFLERSGIESHRIERGGQVTYHGPGQVVGYPILDLRNLKIGVARYVRMLEETMIRAAADLGVDARRTKGIIGIYAAKGKLGSIGVRVTGGISFHGFALNVDPDLDHFDLIVPCGIPGQPVSSIASELDEAPPMTEAMEKVAEAFGRVFEMEIVPKPGARQQPSRLCPKGGAYSGLLERDDQYSQPIGGDSNSLTGETEEG